MVRNTGLTKQSGLYLQAICIGTTCLEGLFQKAHVDPYSKVPFIYRQPEVDTSDRSGHDRSQRNGGRDVIMSRGPLL